MKLRDNGRSLNIKLIAASLLYLIVLINRFHFILLLDAAMFGVLVHLKIIVSDLKVSYTRGDFHSPNNQLPVS